ncbi:hypothetical protein MferCBS31731_001716 [Microsporum ferrugineum]
METVFSYIDGVPDKLPWERVVPIHDILKVLTPGSATVIRFPAVIMFPRAALDEQAVLTLTIRDLYPASGPKVTVPWKRLALLDQIPRGIDALFFNVMSDSNWNVPAQDILQIAKKWTPQLEGCVSTFGSRDLLLKTSAPNMTMDIHIHPVGSCYFSIVPPETWHNPLNVDSVVWILMGDGTSKSHYKGLQQISKKK